jgi:hypothetical protein
VQTSTIRWCLPEAGEDGAGIIGGRCKVYRDCLANANLNETVDRQPFPKLSIGQVEDVRERHQGAIQRSEGKSTDQRIGSDSTIVAAIGNGAAFHKGRGFSSWLGLVPRQHSTGGKARLFGISKRGNNYLRKILVHGARSAVLRVKRERSPFGPWLDALEQRAPINVFITAAANKLARIAWAVLSSGQDYRAVPDAINA